MLNIRPFRRSDPRGLNRLLSEPTNELVSFYINDASFYEEERLARTYDIEFNQTWCGFFAISNYSLTLDKAGSGIREVLERKGIPRTPPAMLLGQLLICESDRGQGIGSLVLRHIVQIALTSPSGCRLVIVDLDEEDVRGFYSKHGWIPAPQASKKMYLDLRLFKRIRNALRKEKPALSIKDELKEFARVQASLPVQRRLL